MVGMRELQPLCLSGIMHVVGVHADSHEHLILERRHVRCCAEVVERRKRFEPGWIREWVELVRIRRYRHEHSLGEADVALFDEDPGFVSLRLDNNVSVVWPDHGGRAAWTKCCGEVTGWCQPEALVQEVKQLGNSGLRARRY